MKNLLVVILTFCLAAGALMAQDKPQDKMQKPAKFSKQVNRSIACEYLIALPPGYETNAGALHPLILFLHGAGERGDDIWRASTHGPSKYAAEHPEFPFILITPQCPAGEVWSNTTLLALLDEVMAKYRVDTNRVYLTGLSMGGYGTWNLGLSHPGRFAAIAPICGGGGRLEVLLAARGLDGPEKQKALLSLPVWAFHGAKDRVVPLEESERMVNALKDSKATEVKFTVYPEADHDSWSQTYNNPELYDWFLKHQRP